MRHLFIDTSFFEENNFFKGKLVRLYQYAKDGYVKLYTNKIVIKEVESRISKKMAVAKSNCSKLFNNPDSYILGNTSQSEAIRKLKDKDYFKRETKRLCSDFDKMIAEIPFTIIPYEDIDFPQIIEDYFSENPPFKEGEKKSEFPDAFIISSIEKYCKKNGVKIEALSNDNDWIKYKPKNFTISDDIDIIFEGIAKEMRRNDAIAFVTHLVDIHKDEILKQLQKYITKNVYFENTDYIDSEIIIFILRELDLTNESITYIDDMSAEVVASVNIDISADIKYPDYENAYWDNEDKVYYFLEEVTSNHDFDVSVDVLLSIEYDLENESFFELEIKSVNNEKPIELTIDHYN